MEKKLNSPKVPVTESSSFEKLMTACLEKKTPTKKGTTKKPLKEKVVKKSTILEEFADEFDSDFKDDFESDMPDIQDDVLVIVDPEMDPEDVKDAAAEAQAIIDGTEEGEIPSTDKYIDDFTYTCPRCGNTFPSEQELSEGDACPVCDDTPEAFVMVGQIKEADVEAEFADEFEDNVEELEDEEDENKEEPAEEEVPEEEVPEEEVKKEEAFNQRRAKQLKNRERFEALRNAKKVVIEDKSVKAEKNERTLLKTNVIPKVKMEAKQSGDELQLFIDDLTPEAKEQLVKFYGVEPNEDFPITVLDKSGNKFERKNKSIKNSQPVLPRERLEALRRGKIPSKMPQKPVLETRKDKLVYVDEKTFNPFLNAFIKENYSNLKSFNLVKVFENKNSLVFECNITTVNGKSKAVRLRALKNIKENFILKAYDDGTFKNIIKENKVAPFMFKVKLEKGVLRCEGLKYHIITKTLKEKVAVTGTLTTEALKKGKPVNFTQPKRK